MSYMAFYQLVKNSASYKNYAFDVSVSNCGKSNTSGHQAFGIEYGDILISNINSTKNKCYQFSSTYSILWGSSGTCNFSTFRKNNQEETGSLIFGSKDQSLTQTVSYCNVIGNRCGTGTGQILFSGSYSTNVDHCIFLNNIAEYMFSGVTLTISDSYVDTNSTPPYGNNIIFENLTVNYNFNNFTHYYIENCFRVPKEITIKLSYLSKFVKSISPSLLSS